MEPRIQYAQTKDGVSIAFWTLGEGMPPILPFGLAFGHAQPGGEFRAPPPVCGPRREGDSCSAI